MALYRVDVVFPMFTGLPRDIIQNTFHIVSTATIEAVAVNCADIWLSDFYKEVYADNSVDKVNYIQWANAKVRVFNMDDPSPRIPWEENLDIGTSGSAASTVPTEVAVVASFQSAGLPGEVYQRRYNRIYLGALLPAYLDASTTSTFPVIDAGFRNRIITAMTVLQSALSGPDNVWVQLSMAGGVPRALPVIGGWVDDSPDTQRRRGVDATSRTTWVAP